MTNFETRIGDIIVSDITKIRNVSIVAHVDSGKTTLADCLIGHGNRALDTDKQETERGITIKSTAISLLYKKKETIEIISKKIKIPEKCEKKEIKYETSEPDFNTKKKDIFVPYCIHLTDTPGHIEFGAEVSSSLRLSDGALIIVDCINGVTSSTKRLIKQLINEKIKPILFINKLDYLFCLTNNLNDLYQKYIFLRKIIEDINVIIKTYSITTNNEKINEKKENKNKYYNNLEINPIIGMCGFGSGLQNWGFTLIDFAKMYFNENLCRKMMTKGAKVMIYSKKKKKWYKGEINSIIYENNEEWLNTRYKKKNGIIIYKQIQRFSKYIKPLTNFIEKSTSLNEIVKRLWGENYWDLDKQQWWPNKNNNKNKKKPKNCIHGFTYFILNPLKKLYDLMINKNKKEYELIINLLNINIKKKEIENELNNYGILKKKKWFISINNVKMV